LEVQGTEEELQRTEIELLQPEELMGLDQERPDEEIILHEHLGEEIGLHEHLGEELPGMKMQGTEVERWSCWCWRWSRWRRCERAEMELLVPEVESLAEMKSGKGTDSVQG
jgi:hypothetical protein